MKTMIDFFENLVGYYRVVCVKQDESFYEEIKGLTFAFNRHPISTIRN